MTTDSRASRCDEAAALAEHGDLAGAEEIFAELAAESPRAAVGLALVRAERGDEAGAGEAARLAIAAGDPHFSPQAQLIIARLAGTDEEAEAAYRAAIDGGDKNVAAFAAPRLAELLLDRGEPVEAGQVLTNALPGAPDIHTLLGIVHLELAATEFAHAVRQGRGEHLPLAVELLARTLRLRGREEEAEEAWRHGLDHPDETVAEEVETRRNRWA